MLIRNLKANSLFWKHRVIYLIVHLVFWTLSQQILFKERVSACLFVLFILTARICHVYVQMSAVHVLISEAAIVTVFIQPGLFTLLCAATVQK